MIYFQSLTKQELAELLLPLSRVKDRGGELTSEQIEIKKQKQALMRAKQIYKWVYQRFADDWDQMTDLSKELREWLKANVQIYRLKEAYGKQSSDGTKKFLWSLGDSKTVESVVIPAALHGTPLTQYSGTESIEDLDSDHWTRLTACISSQVGCAMACKFCLTGIQGLDRHLQTHEIVTQIYELRRLAPITNIVFMGMGEPLHNVENVIKACKIFLDDDGFNFSKRKVTVSTSGLVPAIDELGKNVDVMLAISLNATTDEIRSEIMPVNKKWPIKELLDACKRYPMSQHKRITFEYVLLSGVNDTLEDAARLYRLTRGIRCKINLIPFNEHSGAGFKRPEDATVKQFQHYLVSRGVTATVRISRGRDILAACGQLRSLFGTARGTHKHKDYQEPPVVEQQA